MRVKFLLFLLSSFTLFFVNFFSISWLIHLLIRNIGFGIFLKIKSKERVFYYFIIWCFCSDIITQIFYLTTLLGFIFGNIYIKYTLNKFYIIRLQNYINAILIFNMPFLLLKFIEFLFF